MPPIPFVPFDERGDVQIYHHGALPHWRQASCTYFVTFRLADSLPAAVRQEIAEDRHHWLRNHGINPNATDMQQQLATLPAAQLRDYKTLIATRLNQHLDRNHGSCILRNPKLAKITADALIHHHGRHVWTGDYIIMPNHVHALLTPIAPHTLETILKSIKGFSARMINRATNSTGEVWQRQSHDHIVRDAAQLTAFQRYIANNPTKANLPPATCLHQTATYTQP